MLTGELSCIMSIRLYVGNLEVHELQKSCCWPGADPGFSNTWGAKGYVHAAHNPRAKSKVPYGRAEGPLKGAGRSY